MDLKLSRHGIDTQPMFADRLLKLPGAVRGKRCRVVILGATASGKTTALTLLAARIVESRMPGAPVPLVVDLAGWDPRHERLDDVIRRRISGMPNRTVRKLMSRGASYEPMDLVSEGLVLPILDGLDELPRFLRKEARLALNAALGRPHREFVLACETTVFDELVPAEVVRLGDTRVLVIEPAEKHLAVEYLRRSSLAEDRWTEVFVQLAARHATPMTEVLSSPLMIYLAMVVYEDPAMNPSELCDPNMFRTPESIQAHLLAHYVETIYQSPERVTDYASPVGRRYDADQAQRWLAFLARVLDRNRTTVFMWWQLSRAYPPWISWLFGDGWPPSRIASRWNWKGMFMGVGALIALVAFTVSLGIGLEAAWSWMTGPPAVPSSQLIADLMATPSSRDTAVVMLLGVVLIIGGISGISAPVSDTVAVTCARDHLAADRRSAVARATVVATAIAPLATWCVPRLSGPPAAPDLLDDVLIGLVVSMIGAGFVVWISAWRAFRFNAAVLAMCARSPWSLLTFLEDAHRRGVLRGNGPGYQFRHRIVQRYLASPGMFELRADHNLPAASAAENRNEWTAARRELEARVLHNPAARFELAYLYERRASRYRLSIARLWSTMDTNRAVNWLQEAVGTNTPGAIIELSNLYERQIDRQPDTHIGRLLRAIWLLRAQTHWTSHADSTDETTRQRLRQVMHKYIAITERSSLLRNTQLVLANQIAKIDALDHPSRTTGQPATGDDALEWWRTLHLSDTVERALCRAWTQTNGDPVQTGGLLAALNIEDAYGRWDMFWRDTAPLEIPLLTSVRDTQSTADPLHLPIRRDNPVNIVASVNLMQAMRLLAWLCSHYQMSHVSPGALTLALVSIDEGSASYLLRTYGHLDTSAIRRAAMRDLLGGDLTDYEEAHARHLNR